MPCVLRHIKHVVFVPLFHSSLFFFFLEIRSLVGFFFIDTLRGPQQALVGVPTSYSIKFNLPTCYYIDV